MKHTYKLLFVLIAAAALLATATQAQIRSDDFTGSDLQNFWTFINYLGDADTATTGTQFSISVPFGLSHDPTDKFSGRNRAPRIVQQIATPGTDFGDFTVYAKFDSSGAGMTLQYQMVGIEVIQDTLNYVRCELYSTGSSINSIVWSFTNTGNADGAVKIAPLSIPNGTSPLYMRVQRVNDSIFVYYSTGGNWLPADSLTHVMNADSIGVYVANSDGTTPGTTAPAFTGLIDNFSTSDPLPVQLASFTAAAISQNRVRLDWTTVTETNNYGFYVHRSPVNTNNFERLESSFIPGHGTTIEPHSYSYVDAATPGVWYYKLEQIDLDGTSHFTEPVQATVLTAISETKLLPKEFALKQNYPNPFNPSTIIKFDLPKESRVNLEVFNLIGQKVATLVDAVKPGGSYQIPFNASGLTSGVYFYKLSAGNQTFLKKMVLMK